MMQSTWNFIKNNKKTIFFTASAVVGFVGLKRYFSNFERQWETSQCKSFVSEIHKKGSYFDEAICIGNNMAQKQFVMVIKKLQEMFNIVQLLDNIKTAQANNVSPNDQLKYYEELKNEIFTYIVAEIYCISFLITYLRVQLSMISGVMYYENQINNQQQPQSQQQQEPPSLSSSSAAAAIGGNANNQSSQKVHLKDATSRYYMFMSLLENFHNRGIEHLVDHVRKFVGQAFSNTRVTDKVTLKEILGDLNKVKLLMRESYDRIIEENVLLVFCSGRELGANSSGAQNEPETRILNELKACSKFVDEMVDIAKLPDFRTVVENCIDIGFSNLYDFINECFIQFEKQNFSSSGGDQLEKRQFINPHQINVLLIKILPLIWTQVHNSSQELLNQNHQKRRPTEFNDSKTNRNVLLVQYLLCCDSLTCFTANIYEAFCNEK